MSNVIIPYLNMKARVNVGSIRLENVTSLYIEEKLTQPGAIARIIIPRALKKLKDKPLLDYIKAGDKVMIAFGYNDVLQTEFEGYVSLIEAEAPVVIHCEDEWWKLKQNKWVHLWQKTTLMEVLQKIMSGYTIDCPTMSLGKFALEGVSSYTALKELQRKYGLFARLSGSSLAMGFAYQWQASNKEHEYDLTKLKGSSLKWRQASDVKVNVCINYKDAQGKKQSYKYGSEGGTVINQDLGEGAEKSDAEKVAKAIANQYSYNGFTGTVSGYGVPRTKAGDTLSLQSDQYKEKEGRYVIEAVRISYDENGITRENELAFKI